MRPTSSRPAEDFYALLEVRPNASDEVITAAYRALMKRFHPDAKDGDEKIAKRLNEAHAILSDAAKRTEYDRDRGVSGKGAIIGQYRVLREIAEGGIGTTYEAEHLLVHERVCIKHCSNVAPQYEQILLDETRAAWDLRHYSIPAMRDFLRLDDGTVAIVMSYIPGPTLAEIVEKYGKMDPEHVTWIAQRILNALMYMHYNGVVHGDLKPQNIIIQPESHQVVIVDFGLAMVKPDGKAGAKGYTDYFAAPEQVHGKPILPESDFYGLGMTMIYALGGGLERVLQRKEVPRDTPEPLCEFILRLIVQDVLARPRWERENLHETMEAVREKSFGRKRSNMKPFPWTADQTAGR